ncbi:MAG: hypothetical protein J6B64_01460 [Bacilli bacterium]|nr:hypothetical protein [Bacilli bacterium]MBP3635473.1 hypothetical protein [Bacilli bacterium]
MNEILETLDGHKNLLELLGYTLDLKKGEIPLYKPANILSNGKVVGKLSIERLNLYYLKKDEKYVGNMDLNCMCFGKDKEKNTKTMVHIILNDKKVNIDCYNRVLDYTDESISKFIRIETRNFSVSGTLEGEVISIHYRNLNSTFSYFRLEFIPEFYNNRITVCYEHENKNYRKNPQSREELEEFLTDQHDEINNIIGNNLLENLIDAVYNSKNQDVKRNIYKPE